MKEITSLKIQNGTCYVKRSDENVWGNFKTLSVSSVVANGKIMGPVKATGSACKLC